MPSRRPDDPLVARAQLESNLATAPQASALTSLLADLVATRGRTRSVNNSNAIALQAATRQARPEISSAFDQALGSSQAQRAALGVDNASDPLAQAFARRVGEQRSGALNDLTQRELGAASGRVYANTAADHEYASDEAKVLGQLQELAQQSGAVAASTLGRLARRPFAARALSPRPGRDASERAGVAGGAGELIGGAHAP